MPKSDLPVFDSDATQLPGTVMKFKRVSPVLIVLAICSVLLWIKVILPFIEEGRSAWSALNSESAAGGVFGVNKHPGLPGSIHVKTLDPDLLPRSTKGKTGPEAVKKRLVFIGDIHGCREELEALLKKLRFDPSKDHLVALGDIVSKGPDSLGVIDLLRRYNGSCVRGNHDDRLLLVAQSFQAQSSATHKSLEPGKHTGKHKHEDPVERLARSLSTAQLEYLQTCPIILRIGEMEAFNGEAVAVHAGLVPGLALDLQDPVSAMNMRVLDLATHLPSHKHKLKGSVAWYKLWNRYQQLLNLHKRFGKHKEERESESHTTVIYGHNAKEGLQIRKYTKGLDTGCVKGGKLTALVVDGDGRQQIVQVKAKKHTHRSSLQVDVLRDGGPEAPPSDNSG
ncbi:Ser/Thr protein phosphatase family [Cladophialophora carrionii]|uniref:Ser/Thr protein phosphatase family n=1 Tax=Cladophialophora carrionii TaxID=86049 RepID=A0A1C1CB13_9EURO|nr:Ser/Thr protein phosphatase family [Cladophialophora carrionii]